MFASLRSLYRAAVIGQLTVLVLSLASVSNVRAGNITYNIVDYPVNEMDQYGGTDTVSGTIITDGTLGPLSAANIVGGTFSFTNARADSFTGSLLLFEDPVDLEATPTQLLLDSGSASTLSIGAVFESDSATQSLASGEAVYDNYTSGAAYYGEVNGFHGTLAYGLGYFDSSPVPAVPGSISENPNWVIAAVPEPRPLMLLASILLGSGLIFLRRRAIRQARAAVA